MDLREREKRKELLLGLDTLSKKKKEKSHVWKITSKAVTARCCCCCREEKRRKERESKLWCDRKHPSLFVVIIILLCLFYYSLLLQLLLLLNSIAWWLIVSDVGFSFVALLRRRPGLGVVFFVFSPLFFLSPFRCRWPKPLCFFFFVISFGTETGFFFVSKFVRYVQRWKEGNFARRGSSLLERRNRLPKRIT